MSGGAAAGSWIFVDGDVVRVGSVAVIGTGCVIAGTHSGRGSAHASVRRMAAIVIGIRGFVVSGEILVMLLEGCPALVLVVLGQSLFRARVVMDAVRAAAEGYVAVTGDEASIDTLVILEGGVDVAVVHMHDRGVVVEVVAAPLSAGKADAAVTEAVVHAAVIAHVRAPVALMEAIATTFPTPVGGRPQRAFIRGGHPGAGNPVVASVAVGPVTGSPHHAGLHTGGLLVDRQGRRCNADDDLGTGKRGDGNENDHQHQQKPLRREQKSHKKSSKFFGDKQN
jgi:hypothetical protein